MKPRLRAGVSLSVYLLLARHQRRTELGGGRGSSSICINDGIYRPECPNYVDVILYKLEPVQIHVGRDCQ